jgi:hypothetical protein
VLEDAQFSEAVIHAAPALSGIGKDLHEKVVASALERAYGPQMKGMEHREELNNVVEAALRVAISQFSAEAGLKQDEI